MLRSVGLALILAEKLHDQQRHADAGGCYSEGPYSRPQATYPSRAATISRSVPVSRSAAIASGGLGPSPGGISTGRLSIAGYRENESTDSARGGNIGLSMVIAQPSRFSEWMMPMKSRRVADVFVSGVLCTRSALAIGFDSVVVRVRAGAEA